MVSLTICDLAWCYSSTQQSVSETKAKASMHLIHICITSFTTNVVSVRFFLYTEAVGVRCVCVMCLQKAGSTSSRRANFGMDQM